MNVALMTCNPVFIALYMKSNADCMDVGNESHDL